MFKRNSMFYLLIACGLFLAGCQLDDAGGQGSMAERCNSIGAGSENGLGAWFKGDLHAHTTYSDGDSDVATVIAIAESKDFDFFVLTDHLTTSPWTDPAYTSTKMTLLYGIEWTTDLGHMNIWSNSQFDWDSISPTLDPPNAAAAIAATHALADEDREILISINHPYAFFCQWTFPFDESKDADTMEVWNTRFALPNLNFMSLMDTYQGYLAHGRKMPLVGGSDSHGHTATHYMTYYNNLGNPTTWVYAPSGDAKDILAGIKAGHSYISSYPEGPNIEFLADVNPGGCAIKDSTYEIMMGDSIPAGSLGSYVRFMVRVKNAAVPSKVLIIKNGKPFMLFGSFSPDYHYVFKDKPQKGDYYYVKLLQLGELNTSQDIPIGDLLEGPMAGITNPIYAW